MTRGRFRAIALAESASWIALLAAVVLELVADVGDLTSVVGPVHGVLFLGYLASILVLRRQLRWDGQRTMAAVLASLVPLGAYLLVERRLPGR